jgi:hypothetical protein
MARDPVTCGRRSEGDVPASPAPRHPLSSIDFFKRKELF